MKKLIAVVSTTIIFWACCAQASKPDLNNEATIKKIAEFAGVRNDKLTAYLQQKNIIEKVTDSFERLDSDPPFVCLKLNTGKYHTITPEEWLKMSFDPTPKDLQTVSKAFYKKKKNTQECTLCTIL